MLSDKVEKPKQIQIFTFKENFGGKALKPRFYKFEELSLDICARQPLFSHFFGVKFCTNVKKYKISKEYFVAYSPFTKFLRKKIFYLKNFYLSFGDHLSEDEEKGTIIPKKI
jgi:hypothetical protein